MLVIEADGQSHDEEAWTYDRVREAWLRTQGYYVFRIPNDRLVTDLKNVVDEVVSLIETLREQQ